MEKVINGEDFDPFGSTKLNNQNGKNNEKETRIDQQGRIKKKKFE